jgi:hypothetical protein
MASSTRRRCVAATSATEGPHRPERGDPEIAQILGRQPPQHRIVDVVVAKARRVSFQPQAAQPIGDIDNRACRRQFRGRHLDLHRHGSA